MREEIMHDLEELAYKAQECGINNVAIVLYTLLGCMTIETDGQLAVICQEECKRMMTLINETKASMN
jgi:uncharacterized membrane protein YcaP (DUF421 family)